MMCYSTSMNGKMTSHHSRAEVYCCSSSLLPTRYSWSGTQLLNLKRCPSAKTLLYKLSVQLLTLTVLTMTGESFLKTINDCSSPFELMFFLYVECVDKVCPLDHVCVSIANDKFPIFSFYYFLGFSISLLLPKGRLFRILSKSWTIFYPVDF